MATNDRTTSVRTSGIPATRTNDGERRHPPPRMPIAERRSFLKRVAADRVVELWIRVGGTTAKGKRRLVSLNAVVESATDGAVVIRRVGFLSISHAQLGPETIAMTTIWHVSPTVRTWSGPSRLSRSSSQDKPSAAKEEMAAVRVRQISQLAAKVASNMARIESGLDRAIAALSGEKRDVR